MAKIDDAAVLKRAKELAEKDGFAWELTFVRSIPRTPIIPQITLSEEARREYLARARNELRNKSDNA